MSDFNYEVVGETDGVYSILLKNGPDLVDNDGNFLSENLESTLFYPGNVIPGDQLATFIVDKYEEGDPHYTAILSKVPAEKPKAASAKPKPATQKKEPAKTAGAEE